MPADHAAAAALAEGIELVDEDDARRFGFSLLEHVSHAGSTDADKVSKALLGLTIDTPIGKQTIREKDHQANRGQIYGKTVKDPKYPFPIMKPAEYIDPTKFMD